MSGTKCAQNGPRVDAPQLIVWRRCWVQQWGMQRITSNLTIWPWMKGGSAEESPAAMTSIRRRGDPEKQSFAWTAARRRPVGRGLHASPTSEENDLVVCWKVLAIANLRAAGRTGPGVPCKRLVANNPFFFVHRF
ncbi:MAG: hypothetical protein AAF961_09995 [Planctomycetota bacterium]